MTKKESNKEQIWLSVFTVIPVITLGNLGGDLSKILGLNSIMLSAILGGTGGIVGYGLYFFTKHLNTVIKVSTLIALFAVLGIGVRVLLTQPTDEELVDQEWIGQNIGTVSFSSPKELQIQNSEIPANAAHVYETLQIYTDKQDDRITMFMYADLKTDSLILADSFGGSLEGMLNNIGVDDVELLETYNDETEVVTKLKYERNSKELLGFGFMRLSERKLQAIWLMPVTRTFSNEYIDKFKSALLTNEN